LRAIDRPDELQTAEAPASQAMPSVRVAP